MTFQNLYRSPCVNAHENFFEESYKNLAYVVYSHHTYSDLWPIYFGQVNPCVPPDMAKYFMINGNYSDHYTAAYQKILYEDEFNYSDRLKFSLGKIKEEYLIFSHEDMILKNCPQWHRLFYFKKAMEDNDIDSIKLIRGGKKVGKNFSEEYPELRVMTKDFSYLFAIQPTIWKTTSFLKIVDSAPGCSIWELEKVGTEIFREMNFKGLYVDDGGRKIGKQHWEPFIFPYIATAIVKGRWNSEYKEDLEELHEIYDIDDKERGWT